VSRIMWSRYCNAAPSDHVPQQLAKLGPLHTMLYDNFVPFITDPASRSRYYAWSIFWTHLADNRLTNGSGLGGTLSWFLDDGWYAGNGVAVDPWTEPNLPPRYLGAGLWFLFYPPRKGVNESGPITSLRWELWRSGLEDVEYFFRLQKLLQAGTLPADQASKAHMILRSVGEVVWGFPYYSVKLQRGVTPYSTNTSLAADVRRRAGQLISELSTDY
jgi:hypothetical protein